MEKQANNPMQPERLAKAPRCLAWTRKGTEWETAMQDARRDESGGLLGGTGMRKSMERIRRKAKAAASYLRSVAELVERHEG